MKPEVERQIKELLDAGLIVRSDSPMASPLVCVAKKQGGMRLACDYRYVNSFTVADVFPLCTVDEMISKVGRGRYISLFDAKPGYWQFLVRPEDRWLTAFVTHEGLYSGCVCRSVYAMLVPLLYVPSLAFCSLCSSFRARMLMIWRWDHLIGPPM